MAVQTILIDPVTRIEGHLKIDVKVDTVNGMQKVVDALATGTLFRGFETLLVNRPPADAQHITQRICGVCPVPHGMAAVMALDSASGVTIPSNARIMRNLVMGANFIQSHILHFYHLSLPDYVNGPNMPPWQPSWAKEKQLDANYFNGNYIKALEMTRKAHEMGALFRGEDAPSPDIHSRRVHHHSPGRPDFQIQNVSGGTPVLHPECLFKGCEHDSEHVWRV